MSRVSYAIAGAGLAAACLGAAAYAQQAAPPPFATTKVDGTDNVYVFRYGNAQSMFVVTSAGVIATDPIGYGRPQAVVTYVDEIKKVSSQPIKYVIYSHHHFTTSPAASRSRTPAPRSSRTSEPGSASSRSRIRTRCCPTKRWTPVARSRSATRRSS